MPQMPDFFLETEQRAAAVGRGITGLFEHHHHAADVAPQTPAQPGTMKAATAAAPQQEDTMSLFDDAEAIYAGAKTELGKFEQALPGVLAKAKAFEASPFAQLAEKTAASILPPEAVTIAVNAADKVLDDLIGLYAPAADTAPAQPAGAPAQP